MASDRNGSGDQSSKNVDKLGGRTPVGRGMTSPDSTQVPLRAEDGEPDQEAMRGRAGQQGGAGSDRSGGTSGKR